MISKNLEIQRYELQRIWDQYLTLGAPQEGKILDVDRECAQSAVDALYGTNNPDDKLLANSTVGRFNQRGMKLTRKEGPILRPVRMDDAPVILAYDTGERWNGFAQPYVTISQLRVAAKHYFNGEQGWDEEMKFIIPDSTDGDKFLADKYPEILVTYPSLTEPNRDGYNDFTIYPEGMDDLDEPVYDISMGLVWDWCDWEVTDERSECCGAAVTFHDETLCCKKCWRSI